MIIECINCIKKFNVNSELIPLHGRQIQCGSCNYTWHYKIEEAPSKPVILDNFEKPQLLNIEDNKEIIDNENLIDEKLSTISKQEIDNKINTNDIKVENNSITNFFSYLLVFIISFIALVILLDTLKTPIIVFFPRLEIILFSLFEILKDIKLFIIDLA